MTSNSTKSTVKPGEEKRRTREKRKREKEVVDVRVDKRLEKKKFNSENKRQLKILARYKSHVVEKSSEKKKTRQCLMSTQA